MSFHEPQWYDRNPNTLAEDYNFEHEPHVATTRLTYICPPGKMAMVELLQCKLMRVVAAVAALGCYCYWNFTKKDGSAKVILDAWIFDNTVGARDSAEVGTMLTLTEGDTLTGRTQDTSTDDGKVRYFLSYKITEFDAFEYVSPPVTRPIPEKDDVQQPGAVTDPKM